MKDIIEKIWEKSKIYQDKRDDSGHAAVVVQFAKELLKTEKGNELVVIPAATLHDIGWSQIPIEQRMKLFESMPGSVADIELRNLHQLKSVELAKEILDSVNYPKDLEAEILEIISQHDTREGFLNINDGIMRDADKLWMFSPEGLAADLRRRKTTAPREWLNYLSSTIAGKKFYCKSAYNIAKRELKLRELEVESQL